MFKILLRFPLIKRLIPSVIKRLGIKSKILYRDGIYYNLDLRYFVDRNFYLSGWDDEIINFLNSFIKKNKIDYFLDVGSCWGVYSLQIAKKNPQIKIFSFDVFYKNIERLKSMSEKNNFDNINTFNTAIGLQKKIEKFSVNEDYSPNYAKDLKGKITINVNQDNLDNLVKLSNENIVIKIDVERMELEALEGARELLINNKCFIVIETDQFKLQVIQFLKSLNFKKIEHNFSSNDSFFSNF